MDLIGIKLEVMEFNWERIRSLMVITVLSPVAVITVSVFTAAVLWGGRDIITP